MKYLLLLFMSFSSSIHAQTVILSRFSATTTSTGVLLSWTLDAGSLCNGISVFRGTDSIAIAEIHHIPGVCGDLSKAVTYTFQDSLPPERATYFYRLELGPRNFSQALGVSFIALPNNSARWQPHPVIFPAKLVYRSAKEGISTLQLFNLFGQPIWEDRSENGEFELERRHVQKGTYFWRLILPDNSGLLSGKLIVAD